MGVKVNTMMWNVKRMPSVDESDRSLASVVKIQDCNRILNETNYMCEGEYLRSWKP